MGARMSSSGLIQCSRLAVLPGACRISLRIERMLRDNSGASATITQLVLSRVLAGSSGAGMIIVVSVILSGKHSSISVDYLY